MTKPNGKPPSKPTLVKDGSFRGSSAPQKPTKLDVKRQFRTPSHGRGKLQVGNPGPRDTTFKEFRRACAEALKDVKLWDQLMADLRRAGPKGAPMRAVLFKIHASYAHGMPRQVVELTGRDGGPVELAAVRESLVQKIGGALHAPTRPPQ